MFTVDLTTGEPTIAIWGHYHGGNLGDELVVQTIINEVWRRAPRARIVGISMSPADTQQRHGIVTFPINAGSRIAGKSDPRPTRTIPSPRLRSFAQSLSSAPILRKLMSPARMIALEAPFLWRSFQMLRGIDLIVVAGSGQLLDQWRGPWLHPYTTFRWSLLARLARVPMMYLSIGAGPIDNRLSAFFIRTALASASYVSVRDEHSARVLASIGASGAYPVYPDIGYGLPDPLLHEAAAARAARGDGAIVGLNPMAHEDPRYWPRGNIVSYKAYLRKLVLFTRWLLDNGYTVRLFSSQPRSDGRVADDLFQALSDDGTLDPQRFQSTIDGVEHVQELLNTIATCDWIVAARYHSVLIPLLLDIPVLGLAYNPKTTALFAAAGSQEHCYDIDSFSVESLIDGFRDLSYAGGTRTRELRRARVAKQRAAVKEQFDRIFGTSQSSVPDTDVVLS